MKRIQFPLTRRDFLRGTLTAAAGLATAPWWARGASAGGTVPSAGSSADFSYVLLGDLHFDRLEHHDFGWLAQNHPNDRSQIENYSRITRDVMPGLFRVVRDTVAEVNAHGGPRVAFVLHVGDLVEGLCGSEELAARQNAEALAFVRQSNLGVPFLFAKGNHDVTGAGAPAAFAHAFHPFLTEQLRQLAPATSDLKSARYTIECGEAQIAVFDAYDPASLDWFVAVAERRTAKHFFLLVHPPVVPYGARSTWHLFSEPREKSRREKLLAILGDQNALVLGGHIHKFNSLVRTAGRGRFAQLAVSSVINAPRVTAKTVLSGVAAYNGDQIKVEPDFSPATAAERRAVYAAEAPSVRAFAYADLPGYAVVTVRGASVTAQIFSGTTRDRWRTVDLTGLLAANG